jgi:hypothetical protein
MVPLFANLSTLHLTPVSLVWRGSRIVARAAGSTVIEQRDRPSGGCRAGEEAKKNDDEMGKGYAA